MSAETEWFDGRGADDAPETVRPAWMLYTLLAGLLIVVPLALFGCASPCMQSEEIVTVLGTTDTHIMVLRGHVEICPR